MPDYDDDVAEVWTLYIDINKGCERVTYEALDAYQKITGVNLNAWEIDLVIDLDIMRRANG